MADETPKGLLTEEQTKLVVTVANSDFNAVIEDSLSRIESLVTYVAPVPRNPSPSDIANLAGNLNSVIPAGFLLLHNDLAALKDPDKASSGGGDNSSGFGSAVADLLKPMLIGAGAAVVATGIVKGLFGGVSESTSNHMQTVVDDLNKGLSAEELKDDPTIKAAQKIGFIAYLEAYFLQQSASLLVSGTLEAVGVGAGKAVVGFFNELFGKNDDSVPNKLQELVDAIIMAQKSSDYIGDNAVQTAVKVGMIAYIATYFATQTASMAVDTIATGIAGTIGSAVNSFFRNLFTLGNGPKTYDHIQSLVDILIQAQTVTSLSGNTEVGDAVSSGMAKYISVYFDTQSKTMEANNIASSIGDVAFSAVTGFFKNLFGVKTQDDVNAEKLQELISGIFSDLKISEALEWEEVKEARRAGVASYIKSYFDIVGKASLAKEVVEDAASSAWEGAKKLFSDIFSKNIEKEEDTSSAISNLISIVMDDLDSQDYIGSEEIKQAKLEGIKSYIITYFQTLGSVASEESSYLLSSAIYNANSRANKKAGKGPDAFFEKISDVVFSLEDSDMPSKEDLKKLKQESVLDIAKVLLKANVEDIKTAFQKNTYSRNVFLQSTTSATITPTAEEVNSEQILETLNGISLLLQRLNEIADTISSKDNSPVVVPVTTESSYDLSIDIPG